MVSTISPQSSMSLLLSLVVLTGIIITTSPIGKQDYYIYEQGYSVEMWLFDFFFKRKQKPEPQNHREAVDTSFIKELEGVRYEGYVPMSKGAPMGKSGVTIGAGFDLGQHNVQDLINMGFSTDMIAKLFPYLGKKKWDAVNILREKPLNLSKKDVEIINDKVLSSKIDGIIKLVGVDTWVKLDKGLKTVLASVGFQYGDLRKRTPNFLKSVLSLDVNKVISNLENFGDAYGTRRKKEANYLRKVSLNKDDKGTKNV